MELDILRDALREHVKALAVDIGPRTPSTPDSLVRAANYITLFEDAGLSVKEQNYEYYDQRVANLLAAPPAAAGEDTFKVNVALTSGRGGDNDRTVVFIVTAN